MLIQHEVRSGRRPIRGTAPSDIATSAQCSQWRSCGERSRPAESRGVKGRAPTSRPCCRSRCDAQVTRVQPGTTGKQPGNNPETTPGPPNALGDTSGSPRPLPRAMGQRLPNGSKSRSKRPQRTGRLRRVSRSVALGVVIWRHPPPQAIMRNAPPAVERIPPPQDGRCGTFLCAHLCANSAKLGESGHNGLQMTEPVSACRRIPNSR